MVISRVMRRLLLVAAICLPLQTLPVGETAAVSTAAATTAASSTGILGGLAQLAQALIVGTLKLACDGIAGGISLTKDGVSSLMTKEGASLAATVAAIYGAPMLYKYLTKVPTTKKVKRQPGSWVGGQVLSAWDLTKETGQAYAGFGRYAIRKALNSPTYLVSSLYSGLDWDKTNRKDNRPLEAYKAMDGKNNSKDMPTFGVAIMSGNEKAVDAYLGQLGFSAWEYNDGEQGSASGVTGLMLACRFAHPTIFERFVAAYTGNIDHQDKNGLSALMHAVMIPRAIKTDIANTTDVQLRQRKINAQEQNRARIVQDLIQFPAQIQLKDSKKRNALMYAASSGLFRATKHIADAMESQGYDLNDQDEFGKTALVYAVEGGHVNTVKLFLTQYKGNKVNVNKGEIDGSDALARAKALMEKVDAEIRPIVQRCEVACNRSQTKAVTEYEQEHRARLTAQQQEALRLQRLDAMVMQQNPNLHQKYNNTLEILELLDKASQAKQEDVLDIAFDVDGLDNSHGLMQFSADISEDEIGYDAFGSEDVTAGQAQATTAAPAEHQTSEPQLTTAALAAHDHTAAQQAPTQAAARRQSPPAPSRSVAPRTALAASAVKAPVNHAKDSAARRQQSRVAPAAAAVPRSSDIAPDSSNSRGSDLVWVFDRDPATQQPTNHRQVTIAQRDAMRARKDARMEATPAVQAGNDRAYQALAERARAQDRQRSGVATKPAAKSRAQSPHRGEGEGEQPGSVV